jgi:hypothetical protein
MSSVKIPADLNARLTAGVIAGATESIRQRLSRLRCPEHHQAPVLSGSPTARLLRYANRTQEHGNHGHQWNRWTKKRASSRRMLETTLF